MIPEGWKESVISELAEVDPETLPSTTNDSEVIDYISLEDVSRGRLLATTRLMFSEAPSRARRAIRKNDVLFGTVRPNLQSHLYYEGDLKRPVASTGFAVVRAGRESDSRFIFFSLMSDQIQVQVDRIIAGSNYPAVSSRDVRTLSIMVPPPREQRAIAEALSDADALVESLDALIAKKRDMKQAAMQQLLTGRTRLPGFTDKWRTVTLSDCVDRIYGGGTPSRAEPDYWSGATPWVTVKDLATHDTRMTQEYISAQGLLSSSAQLVPPGQVIVCTRMAPGKAVMYEVDVAINQDMKALIAKSDVYPPFLLCVLNARADELATISSGSTVAGLSVADLRSLQLSLPAIEEQQAIAEVLSDMDAEIDALIARREKAELVKQGMMQELLSGRVRLA